MSERFMVCPACGKRGVHLYLRAEDFYGCRYCDWYAFSDGNDDPDVEGRLLLATLNPDHLFAPAIPGQ